MAEKEVGTVTHYFNKISVGIVELSAPLAAGDVIHIKGAHDDFMQTVDSMQIEHDTVESADAGDLIGIKVTQKVHPGDTVSKVLE